MSKVENKLYLLLLLLCLILSCGKQITVSIENNNRYIKKKMDSRLIINLKSHKNDPIRVSFILHNFTDDISDMPIFQQELMVYPGANVYIIRLNEIGIGKYSLRLYYNKDLIDYRILEVSSE